ncbi:MAG: stage II sporulation protein P [Bacillota bacterium]
MRVKTAISKLIPTALVLTLIMSTAASAHEERTDRGYFTLFDELGKELVFTGHLVSVGDEFIAEDNRHYRVISIDGDFCHTEYLGVVDLEAATEQPSLWSRLTSWIPRLSSVQTQASNQIAIYHTHSSESYIPTDGSEATPGRGGIYRVGSALARALEQQGFSVEQDMTSHEPHDARAYERSRRTASRLLQKRPLAIFDIHRDSAPPEAYEKQLNGENLTQVMLVVGRQNPQFNSNLAFAKSIKAAADKQVPGLIRGIFMAQGKYNQDMHPRAMLFEIGAQTNDREAAERGAAKLASVLPAVLGAAGAGPQNRGSYSAIGWILIALAVGAVLYLVLATGGLKEAKERLRTLTTKEFANAIGWFARKRQHGDDRNKQ